MMMTIGLHSIMITAMLLALYTGYVLGQNSTTVANTTDESPTNASTTAACIDSSSVSSVTVGSGTVGSEGQHSTAAVALVNKSKKSLSANEDDNNDLLIGIGIGGGAVLGAVLVVCVIILVVLRVSAMKKRRISTSPPECDTQPLEMKNEQSTEP